MRDIMLSIYRRARPVSWSHLGHTTEHKNAKKQGPAPNRAYWLCPQPSLVVFTMKRVYKSHFF